MKACGNQILKGTTQFRVRLTKGSREPEARRGAITDHTLPLKFPCFLVVARFQLMDDVLPRCIRTLRLLLTLVIHYLKGKVVKGRL
jgi:hypothetical protein